MTDREKAIVMAYTGICMLKGEKIDIFYQYLYELYNRPVYTHELMTLNIKEMSKSDFLRLCKEEELEQKCGQWITVENDIDYYPFMCSECYETVIKKTNYCPNCGAKMVEE